MSKYLKLLPPNKNYQLEKFIHRLMYAPSSPLKTIDAFAVYDYYGKILNSSLASEVQGWISVKDQLPEDHAYVLMAASTGLVTVTFYTPPEKRLIDDKVSAKFEHANKYGYEVTHWMPLPEAPKNERVE